MRYLEYGRLGLFSNRAERSIKPFVMGRKNWLFSNTPAGTQSSAVIYSMIEAAKENNLDPHRYMVWLLHNAPERSQTDTTWVGYFFPMNYRANPHISFSFQAKPMRLSRKFSGLKNHLYSGALYVVGVESNS